MSSRHIQHIKQTRQRRRIVITLVGVTLLFFIFKLLILPFMTVLSPGDEELVYTDLRSVNSYRVPDGRANFTSLAEECGQYKNCIECLFDVPKGLRSGVISPVITNRLRRAAGKKCVWCASTASCVAMVGDQYSDHIDDSRSNHVIVEGESRGNRPNVVTQHPMLGLRTSASQKVWVNNPVIDADLAALSNSLWGSNKRSNGAPFVKHQWSCPDAETSYCPAILHTQPPQNYRVIHVGIRKGGPEALLQLHLSLNDWGFKNSLDTRKIQKGGDVVPFFKEMYAKELARAPAMRWFSDFKDWVRSGEPGDVLIATETWQCIDVRQEGSAYEKNKQNLTSYSSFYRSGVRQMQWHLTIWPFKDRSACTLAGHTHHIAAEYTRQSSHALFFPYISPHIIRLATVRHLSQVLPDGESGMSNAHENSDKSDTSSEEHPQNLSLLSFARKLTALGHDHPVVQEIALRSPYFSLTSLKSNLVLYDSDTKLTDNALKSNGSQHDTKIATGYTPQELYNLYAKAKSGIDIKLPGGERFIYEAVLFDVCVVVDSSLNGGSFLDFPIPPSFVVKAGSDQFLKDLNNAKDLCVTDYTKIFPSFSPSSFNVSSVLPGKRRIRNMSNDGRIEINTNEKYVTPPSHSSALPFDTLKSDVIHQRNTFYRQVRRYYSNSVRIVTEVRSSVVEKEKESDKLPPGSNTTVITTYSAIIRFIICNLIAVPFATIDVLFETVEIRDEFLQSEKKALDQLKTASWLAAVSFIVVNKYKHREDYSPKGSTSLYPLIYYLPDTSQTLDSRTTLYGLWLPLSHGGHWKGHTVHMLGSILAADSLEQYLNTRGARSGGRDLLLVSLLDSNASEKMNSNDMMSYGVFWRMGAGTTTTGQGLGSVIAEALSSQHKGDYYAEGVIEDITSAISSRIKCKQTNQPKEKFLCSHDIWRKVT